VWYAGYKVGTVKDIRIAREASDRIALSLSISPEAPVRQDSHAAIRALGMMGAKYVEISPGSPDSPELADGATLEGKSPASFSEIMETGREVATGLVDLVNESRNLINEVRTQYSVKETIQSANGLLVDLRGQAVELGPILKNLRRITNEGGNEVVGLLKDVRTTNSDLQKRLEKVETELTRTLGQVDKGFSEGELTAKEVRTILSANEDSIASLLAQLDETSRNLKTLSEDLRDHPWKVVWKSDGEPGIVPAGSQTWREKGRIGPYGKK
jgi:phospholipid/cholesterol/gamma-HCH transport system substrate-binding protein